jgi:hypothetical protein
MKSIAKRHNIAKRQKKEKSFTKGTGKIEAVSDALNRLSSASMARVAYTSSPPTATTFGSLSKDVSELRVIFVLISVMNTYVSLQVVWPRILVLAVWTKRAYVSR